MVCPRTSDFKPLQHFALEEPKPGLATKLGLIFRSISNQKLNARYENFNKALSNHAQVIQKGGTSKAQENTKKTTQSNANVFLEPILVKLDEAKTLDHALKIAKYIDSMAKKKIDQAETAAMKEVAKVAEFETKRIIYEKLAERFVDAFKPTFIDHGTIDFYTDHFSALQDFAGSLEIDAREDIRDRFLKFDEYKLVARKGDQIFNAHPEIIEDYKALNKQILEHEKDFDVVEGLQKHEELVEVAKKLIPLYNQRDHLENRMGLIEKLNAYYDNLQAFKNQTFDIEDSSAFDPEDSSQDGWTSDEGESFRSSDLEELPDCDDLPFPVYRKTNAPAPEVTDKVGNPLEGNDDTESTWTIETEPSSSSDNSISKEQMGSLKKAYHLVINYFKGLFEKKPVESSSKNPATSVSDDNRSKASSGDAAPNEDGASPIVDFSDIDPLLLRQPEDDKTTDAEPQISQGSAEPAVSTPATPERTDEVEEPETTGPTQVDEVEEPKTTGPTQVKPTKKDLEKQHDAQMVKKTLTNKLGRNSRRSENTPVEDTA